MFQTTNQVRYVFTEPWCRWQCSESRAIRCRRDLLRLLAPWRVMCRPLRRASFWEPRRGNQLLRSSLSTFVPLSSHFPSVSISFHLYSYFQHFGTSSYFIQISQGCGTKKGPSAQRRCPPGAAWWGAHVDSSKVASKYLSAPQVPISPQALKPIWRGRRSNTPHNQ